MVIYSGYPHTDRGLANMVQSTWHKVRHISPATVLCLIVKYSKILTFKLLFGDWYLSYLVYSFCEVECNYLCPLAETRVCCVIHQGFTILNDKGQKSLQFLQNILWRDSQGKNVKNSGGRLHVLIKACLWMYFAHTWKGETWGNSGLYLSKLRQSVQHYFGQGLLPVNITPVLFPKPYFKSKDMKKINFANILQLVQGLFHIHQQAKIC